MCNWHNDSTDELCEAILSLKTREECYAFLEDICTIKELLEMSQRLSVAKLLSDFAENRRQHGNHQPHKPLYRIRQRRIQNDN